MSSTEPPTPPAGDPTPPPPPMGSTPPPPPPPPVGAAAPMAGGPVAAYGPGSPGSLLDRFLARLIDSIIIAIPVVIVTTVLSIASGSWLVSNLIAGVVYSVGFLGYFGFMESNRGGGIGKTVMKLKVVGPDGTSNPTMEQAIKRNIYLGSTILYVIPILGPLVAFVIIVGSEILIAVNINGDHVTGQHWFDKFAGGTKVIKVG